MKNNKLFSAMGNMDEELINEAVNAPKKKGLPVFRITAAAAAMAFVAIAAAVLVNINKQPDIINETKASDSRTAEKTNNANSVSKDQSDKAIPAAQTSKAPRSDGQTGSSPSVQPATSTSENQTSEQVPVAPPVVEDESSDILGYIIMDGKTYYQVFANTEYTLDKDIGRAGDFRGAYYGLEDNSRVYTVKEDDKILVVRCESGGSVTLMLWDEYAQDKMGYYRFNGLRVDRSLMAALNSNDGKAYSVYVTRPDSDDMYDYVYNGRTLKEIREEKEECQKTEAILQWVSGQITDSIFLSGRDDAFLEEASRIKESYRISGTDTYDTEKAKENALSYSLEAKNLEYEFQAALDAFLKEKIKAVYDILKANGIKAELINEVRCEMTMTKEQFEALAAANSYLDEYAFGLSAGGYIVDDED